MKPVIWFDNLKDEFYPNGCWMCGVDRAEDKGVGNNPKEAYLDWINFNKKVKSK